MKHSHRSRTYSERMTLTRELPPAAVRSWSPSALLWVIALTIMAVFQLWRGAPIDGLIFAVVAVVLVVERAVRLRRAASPARLAPRTHLDGSRRLAIVVAVALAALLVIVVAPRTGPVSITLTAGLGLGAVALVWNRASDTHARPPESRRRSKVAWASVGITLALWEALAYILSVAIPRGWIGFPTVSLLLEPAVEFDLSRALLTAAWLVGGVWLVTAAVARRPVTRAAAVS